MCAKTNKKRRVIRFFSIGIVVLILLAITAVVAFPFCISSGSGQGFVKNKINKAIDGSVEFNSFSMGWFSGIEFKKLTFDNSSASVAINRLSSKPSYLSFLTEVPDIGETVIETPVIKIKLDEKSAGAAKDELGDASNVSEKELPPMIFLPKMDLKISDGYVLLETADNKSLELRQIAAEVDLNGLEENNRVTVELYAKSSSSPAEAHLDVRSTVKLGNDKKGWTLKGTTGSFNVKVDGLELESLKPVFEMLGYDVEASGKIDADVVSSVDDGQIETVQAKVRAKDIDIAVDGNTVKSDIVNADIFVTPTADRYDVKKFELVTDFLLLKANGAIGKDFASRATVDYDLRTDLYQLQKQLSPFVEMQGFAVSGNLVSSGKISGTTKKISVYTNATRLDNPSVYKDSQELFKQGYVDILFDGEIDVEGKNIEIKNLDVNSPQIKIEKFTGFKTQSGKKTKLAAKFDYELDLDLATKIAKDYMPDELEVGGKSSGGVSVSSFYLNDEVQEMDKNLSGEAGFGFDYANYLGLKFGKTKMNVAFEKGLLNIKPFSAPVNQGAVNFSANVDFNKTPVILRLAEPMAVVNKVQVDKEMAKEMLMYLNPMFADVAEISGVTNFYCEQLEIPLMPSDKNLAIVKGTVGMNDIKLVGTGLINQITKLTGQGNRVDNIAMLPTDFVLENGLLHYDRMQINFDNNPLTFAGDIFLDKRMALTIELPWTYGGRTARVGDESSNRIKLSVLGTVDDPRINTDKLIEEAARKILEREAGKLLEELFK